MDATYRIQAHWDGKDFHKIEPIEKDLNDVIFYEFDGYYEITSEEYFIEGSYKYECPYHCTEVFTHKVIKAALDKWKAKWARRNPKFEIYVDEHD